MSVIDGLFTWGDSIETILMDWEHMGVFEYVLPFLLVFALVFGIMFQTRIVGENKGVIAVISLAVGLLAITSFELRSFFRVLFPYAGIGIAVLLVALILMGLFVTKKGQKGFMTAFFVIGGVIALIVIISAMTSYKWFGGDFWYRYSSALVALLVIGGLVALVIAGSKKSSEKRSGPFWAGEDD